MMNEPKNGQQPPKPGRDEAIKDSEVASSPEPDSPKALTPEEQMALYEKQLKEDDWGHQPC